MIKKETCAKDNLRSWIVLAAVIIMVFLETGMMKALSVLLPDLREQLSSSTWVIGSSISVVYGWGYILGMFSGALLKKFGPRLTMTVSGCLTSLGLIVCSCASNVYILLCGLLLVGFALLQENIAIGMLSHYFDKYFAFAVSIFLFGGNISVIIVPPVTQAFLETYGLRGTLILLSGISFHTVLCGVLIKQNHDKLKSMNMEQNKTSSLPESDRNAIDDLLENCKGLSRFILKDMGGSLLSNTHFIVRVLVPGFVWGYTFSGWLIYTVSYALSYGASMKEAAFVSTCGGIGLTVTRLILPFVAKHIHYKYLIYISLLGVSTSLCLATIWVTLYGMFISSAMFGVASSILGASAYMAAKDDTDDEEYVNAVAWYHLVFGFASILTGTLSGVIYDVTGSFKTSYAVLAAVPLFSILTLGWDDLRTRIIGTKNLGI